MREVPPCHEAVEHPRDTAVDRSPPPSAASRSASSASAPPRFPRSPIRPAGEVHRPRRPAPPRPSPPRAARTPSPSSRATACASPTFPTARTPSTSRPPCPAPPCRPSRSTATCTCCRSRRCRTSRPASSTATSSTSRGWSSTATTTPPSAPRPVILEFADGPTTFGAPLPGVELGAPLESVGGAAATADHATAASTWNALTAASGASTFSTEVSLGGGIEAIHLDGKVQATLDSSVPWIGAPAAWEAGYTGSGVTVAVLDTGYDDTHPDLAGRVLAEDSKSFVPGEDDPASDLHGHGTHVASTIAGTGAASGGANRGVADGGGPARRQGARRRRLRPGLLDHRGDAVGRRARRHRVHEPRLIRAVGRHRRHVGGAGHDRRADRRALRRGRRQQRRPRGDRRTRCRGEGAHRRLRRRPDRVRSRTSPTRDRSRTRAPSSPSSSAPARTSRRPARPTAPARGRTSAMSGTSMATPHVAGAAALLKQQHPEYTADQLRAALVSTAKDVGLTSYEGGSGVVDLESAIDAPVIASGSGDFGMLAWGEEPEPVVRTIDYTNRGGDEVVVDLAASLDGAPDGVLTMGADELTIPAGETRSVELTVDPAKVETGTQLSGALIASIDGTEVARTALGTIAEQERYDLTVTATGFDGEPIGTYAVLYDVAWDYYVPFFVDGETTMRLPDGEYSVMSFMTVDHAADESVTVLVGDPDLVLDSDAEVAFDARADEAGHGRRRRRRRRAVVQPTRRAGRRIQLELHRLGDQRRVLRPADDGAERRIVLVHEPLAPGAADAPPGGGQGAARPHHAARIEAPRRHHQGGRRRRRHRQRRGVRIGEGDRQGRRRDALRRGVGVRASGERPRRGGRRPARRERRRRRVQRVGGQRGLHDRGRPPRRVGQRGPGPPSPRVDLVEEGHDHRRERDRSRGGVRHPPIQRRLDSRGPRLPPEGPRAHRHDVPRADRRADRRVPVGLRPGDAVLGRRHAPHRARHHAHRLGEHRSGRVERGRRC